MGGKKTIKFETDDALVHVEHYVTAADQATGALSDIEDGI